MESNDNNQVTTATENAQRNLDQDSLLQNGLRGGISCFRDCEARCRFQTVNVKRRNIALTNKFLIPN